MLRLTLLAVICLGLNVSCVSQTEKREKSQTKDLTHSPSGNNVALLFASPLDLTGSPVDVENMEEALKDPAYGYSFKIFSNKKAKKSEILKAVKEHAAKADTLLWFYSGHGADNGMVAVEPEDSNVQAESDEPVEDLLNSLNGHLLDFAEVVKAIESVRTTPLKRLLVFVDACYSGNLVNGETTVIPSAGAETGTGSNSGGDETEQDSYAVLNHIAASLQKNSNAWNKSPIYEEALVFTSSSKDQQSAEISSGGYFASALVESFRVLKGKNPQNATIRDLVKRTQEQVSGQTPVYRAFPDKTLLDDLLFGGGHKIGELFAMIGSNPDSDDTVMWISGPKTLDLKKAAICRGTEEACRKTPREDLSLDVYASNVQDRTFFRSKTSFDVKDGETLTLLGFDASNNIAAASAITIKVQ